MYIRQTTIFEVMEKTFEILIRVKLDERNNQKVEVLYNCPQVPREVLIAWMEAAVEAGKNNVFGSKIIVPK